LLKPHNAIAMGLAMLAASTSHALAAQDENADPVLQGQLQICASCHGPRGAEPIEAAFPILAGQEFYYLYVQLKDYKSGLRQHSVMSPIASALDKDQMKALAQYFSEQQWPVIEHETDPARLPKAKSVITAGQCVACHLSGFEGNSRVPRLAGQQYGYLLQTMLNFKSRDRNNAPDKSSLLGSLSDEELASMSDYLSGLKVTARP
jgi:cytochrome c553